MNKYNVEYSTRILIDLADEPIRVLHVDDEESVLKVSKQCLEIQGGILTESAISVDDALQKLKTNQFDAIVSDYQMPEKDGLELLKELRGNGNNIPFIIFTGKGREEVAIKALNLGADQYINKIGDAESVYCGLANSIRNVVKNRQTFDQKEKIVTILKATLDSTNDGLLVVDNKGMILLVNPRSKEIWKIPDSLQDSVKTQDALPFILDQLKDPASFMKRVEELVNRPDTDSYDIIELKDGRVLERHSRPLKVGKLVSGRVWSFRDITEREKVEKTIRESQQKLEALFMHNPEAAVYLDVDFNILDANPRFCQLFGYSEKEIRGRHINEVVVPENKVEEAVRLDKDAKDGYASFYTVRKRKDRSLVPVSISAAPVTFENKLLGFVGVYKDITELKKTQNELEESRKHFRRLFNLMADPVAIVDEKGKILDITEKVEETTGFGREELVGKNFLRVEIATTKTKAIMIKNLAKRMLGSHIAPYEVEILTKDKRKLLFEINAAKIDYQHRPADLVVFRDISERKKLEEKLRVVGNLTRHDVRNKLCTVTGNIYLLRRKLAGDSEALETLSAMDAAIQKMVEIFDFARSYEGLGVEKLTSMNIGKAVDDAVLLFSDLRGVKIVNECRGLTVLSDSLLMQIFYNLIDDSLKYGEKVQTIKIYCRKQDKNWLELVYEDDGVGIPSKLRTNLFKEGVGKGSGYGLFLIKRICEVYGWTIREEGLLGKGVKFVFGIPNGGK